MSDKYGIQINTAVFVNEIANATEDLLLGKISEFLDAKGYNRIIEINGANLIELIKRGSKLVYCKECTHFNPYSNYEFGYCRKRSENMTDFSFCHRGERGEGETQ
jgi:hypothetical protein